jgi:type 1 glutamine amidotransferase
MPYVAWTNEYGKSRVVYIQSGHDNNAYINPNFRKIIYQAIEWVSR